MDARRPGEGADESRIRELEGTIRRLQDEIDALDARESRFRAIFENEPECVKLLAADGTLLEMNPAGLGILEAGSLQEVQGRSVYPYVAAEHREAFIGVTDRVMRGEHCTLEFELIGIKGGHKWLETHASPLRDASGTISALLGITRDVTARRNAEAALRETEARLLAVFRSCPVGVAIHRWPDRVCVDVNAMFTTLLGWRPEDVIGRTVTEAGLVSEQDAAQLNRRIREGASVEGVEVAVATRSGDERHVLLGTQVVELAGGPHVISTFVDITERKRAEEALRASEARFRELAETIRDVFWITDAENTRLLYVSPAYEAVFGRTCAGLYAEPRSWLEAVHPEDRARVRAVADAQRCTGFDHEYRVQWADGAIRWIRDRSFPVMGPDGTIERVVGLASDITDRKAIEAQMHEAQKLESVGRLAAGIAHDFNNVLAVITGVSELAAASVPEGTLRDDLAAIHQAASRAAGLTRQLLAYSRKQVLKPEVLHLNEVVEETEGLLRRVLGDDVRVVVRLGSGLAPVLADPVQIHQVLLNLAVNSRDAMPRGGVLTIETGSVVVAAADGQKHPGLALGRHVVLSLSDTGVGMDETTRQRLFEPFFTTKAPGAGTGLGLATVHGIVKQSGGEIQVTSEPGRGTRFIIYLPECQEPVARRSLRPLPAPTRGTECVLVVDDDDAVREMTRRVLSQQGLEVIVASDGAQALSLIETSARRVDLLVTDFAMPGMSGRELVERVRERHPTMRVLVASGYAEDVVESDGLLGDGTHFIAKPYSVADMLQRVREALDARAPGNVAELGPASD